MAKLGTRTIARIRQCEAEAHARRQHPVDLGQRNLTFAAGEDRRLGHARTGTPPGILRPCLRQEQPQRHRDRHLGSRQGQRNQRLTVRFLARLAAILPRHADRQCALLGQRGVINHQHRARSSHQPIRLMRQHGPERTVVPGRAGNEMLELVMSR
jgi:hypothetical protein